MAESTGGGGGGRGRQTADPHPTLQEDQLAAEVQERFKDFLENFTVEQDDLGETSQMSHSTYSSSGRLKYYVDQVGQMKEQETTTMYVDYSHLHTFDVNLVQVIESEFYRYEPYLRRSVQDFVKSMDNDANARSYAEDERGGDKEFFVAFYGVPTRSKVRELRTDKIGQLVAINGTVTRTSEVRPELFLGVFKCRECGQVSSPVVQQFKYTEPAKCSAAQCENTSSWSLDTDKSKFVDWQRLRLQENSEEIPPGSMPRSVDIILRNETVERAKPGDKAVFTGTLIVVPDVSKMSRGGESATGSRGRGGRGDGSLNAGVTGLKALGVRDLTYKLAFLTSSVAQSGSDIGGQYDIRSEEGEVDIASQFSADERDEIMRMKETPFLYDKMMKSIAPTVFGHDQIRRGILLMLFGGVHKQTPEGMRLRGDINICVVGDPSTAKSQFLKYVCTFLPRAVYTSGKASSAAGLTASVVKDVETGEFCIEAGALLLADNGICCIDEFDKMDVTDQVAIHEAMEQQTISITKAGIQATLNARTSILAACNPIYGRYDKTKTLKANLQLSAPIMSRFDLLFVICDDMDEVSDYAISQHIVHLHQYRRPSPMAEPEFGMGQLQRYIKFARSFNPVINAEAQQELVQSYRELRAGDAVGASKTAYRITVRQLEAMVRLSEALARLHLDDEVRPEYVREAYRLLKLSIANVETAPVDLFDEGREEDETADGPLEDEAAAGNGATGGKKTAAAVDDSMGLLDDDVFTSGSSSSSSSSSSTALVPAPEPSAMADVTNSAVTAASSSSERKGHEALAAQLSQGTAGTDAAAASSGGTGAGTDAAATGTAGGGGGGGAAGDKPKKRGKIQITYEKYVRIKNMVVRHIRATEGEEGSGIRRGDLVEWYLSEQTHIETEEALLDECRIVKRVIQRLINKDQTLVRVEEAEEEDDEMLMVHLNFSLGS